MATSEIIAGAKISTSSGTRSIHWSATEPAYAHTGRVWIDTSGPVPVFKWYDGSAWRRAFNSTVELVYEDHTVQKITTDTGTSWTVLYTIPVTITAGSVHYLRATMLLTESSLNPSPPYLAGSGSYELRTTSGAITNPSIVSLMGRYYYLEATYYKPKTGGDVLIHTRWTDLTLTSVYRKYGDLNAASFQPQLKCGWSGAVATGYREVQFSNISLYRTVDS